MLILLSLLSVKPSAVFRPYFQEIEKPQPNSWGNFWSILCLKLLVPREGLEPTHHCWKRKISPSRLPFRHLGSGISCLYFRWRRRADSNLRIEVLQTSALVHLATSPEFGLLALVVPRAGLEPTRAYAHGPLKTACLPIPPPRPV